MANKIISTQTDHMTGLTAELVVDGRVPQTPALAPNGQLLCYVLAPISRTGDHLDTALWLADIEGDGVWSRVTADTATESQPRWSTDSRALYFLSDRAERGSPQLHRLSPADGAVIALTGWRAGIIDHLPLADLNLVALLAEDEPTEQDMRRARDRDDAIVVGEREPRARLRLLDLRTGQVTPPRACSVTGTSWNCGNDPTVARSPCSLRPAPTRTTAPAPASYTCSTPQRGPRKTSDRSRSTHNPWPGGRLKTVGTSVTSPSPHRSSTPAPPCLTWL
ncbi:TolB family protein [Amycolatopsis lurida]